MDNIIINLDDGLTLGNGGLPNLNEQTDIISQSDAIVGPAGPAGPQGPAGRDGEAATITVGTTTTGAAGTNASVTNSGTSSAAVLNFTIPRGDRGETGATGATGATGPAGADGQAATITVGSVQTVAPEYPATVTNSGTTSAAVLDFKIPRGLTGETGPAGADGQDGADGQAATITVGSTTTGAAGTNASVTNSGTSSAAILDFIIPRGETGATGATGPAGADAIVRTATDTSGRTGIYFNNGTLIVYRKTTFSVNVSTAWGSLYRGTYNDYIRLAPSNDTDFISAPVVSVTFLPNSSQSFWSGAWENGNVTLVNGFYAIPANTFVFVRPTTNNNVNVDAEIIAIGKWK